MVNAYHGQVSHLNLIPMYVVYLNHLNNIHFIKEQTMALITRIVNKECSGYKCSTTVAKYIEFSDHEFETIGKDDGDIVNVEYRCGIHTQINACRTCWETKNFNYRKVVPHKSTYWFGEQITMVRNHMGGYEISLLDVNGNPYTHTMFIDSFDPTIVRALQLSHN